MVEPPPPGTPRDERDPVNIDGPRPQNAADPPIWLRGRLSRHLTALGGLPVDLFDSSTTERTSTAADGVPS